MGCLFLCIFELYVCMYDRTVYQYQEADSGGEKSGVRGGRGENGVKIVRMTIRGRCDQPLGKLGETGRAVRNFTGVVPSDLK